MKVKYRTIKDEDSVIVITEDGGIAIILDVEPGTEYSKRESTTEYYKEKFSLNDLKNISEDEFFDKLSEGSNSYNDWETTFDDPALVGDALEWLAPGCEYVLDETIWKEFDSIIYNKTFADNLDKDELK